MENNSQLPDIEDVADWFLSQGSLQHKKLQKLCYYAVAWHYALLDHPLCLRDTFQAWVHGPVSAVLFEKYKKYGWTRINSKECGVDFGESLEVLEFVWESYKDLSQFQLENLTHEEFPWENARGSYQEFEPASAIISIDDMKLYYRKLYEDSQND
ncbi:Panacea domain-containing protein [Methanolapillus millepedarum]|uniref:Antitoxin SocA-like Panacea domain-containing protein n=1 Tax=Methanolapillus millepedarum TaxID=3028296 RepID=A0AA96V447_9EURY|nr:hypothetical protein MsAc7_08960 [Methanosarcinaceae archaeon Ac7]